MVVGAPASSVANTPGTPSVLMTLACWKPASSASWRIYSAPSLWLMPMLAIVGSAIQSCSRFTDVAWAAFTAPDKAARSLALGAAITGADRTAAAAAINQNFLILIPQSVNVPGGRLAASRAIVQCRGD